MQVNYDDNNPFSEGFQERERRERLREQQERQRVQLLQEVRHHIVFTVTMSRPSLNMQLFVSSRWSVTRPCSREWSWSSRLSTGPQGPLALLLLLLQQEKICLKWPSSVLNHHRTFCRHAQFPGLLSRTKTRLFPGRAAPKELRTLELYWHLVSGPALASLSLDPYRGSWVLLGQIRSSLLQGPCPIQKARLVGLDLSLCPRPPPAL